MYSDDVPTNRRTVLKTVGGTAVGLAVTVGAASADHEHPDVVTGPANDITQTSARIHGEVEEFGEGADTVDAWFQWDNYFSDDFSFSTEKQTLDSPDFYNEEIFGLSSDTTYKYRAVAEDNDDGDRDYGDTATFTTLSDDENIK